MDRYELNGRPAYVLVVPDEKGRTATYDVPVPKSDTVLICVPAIGRDAMTRTARVSTTGTTNVNVSETPTFVVGLGNGLRPLAAEPEGELGTLLVYPNPTADHVDITVENGLTDAMSVAIYDTSAGRRQQSSFSKSSRAFRERVDLSALPAGLYLLEVRQGQARAVRKIIKVR